RPFRRRAGPNRRPPSRRGSGLDETAALLPAACARAQPAAGDRSLGSGPIEHWRARAFPLMQVTRRLGGGAMTVAGDHPACCKSGSPRPSRFRNVLRAGAAFCCLSALGAGGAPAQAPPQPTAPTREQIQPPQPVPIEAPPARLTIEGGIEHAPCALDRPDYQNIRFTLRDVVFDDLRGLPAAR